MTSNITPFLWPTFFQKLFFFRSYDFTFEATNLTSKPTLLFFRKFLFQWLWYLYLSLCSIIFFLDHANIFRLGLAFSLVEVRVLPQQSRYFYRLHLFRNFSFSVMLRLFTFQDDSIFQSWMVYFQDCLRNTRYLVPLEVPFLPHKSCLFIGYFFSENLLLHLSFSSLESDISRPVVFQTGIYPYCYIVDIRELQHFSVWNQTFPGLLSQHLAFLRLEVNFWPQHPPYFPSENFCFSDYDIYIWAFAALF